MDVFQLIGDFLHLIAVLMLLLKILANKNVIGISYKTQEIYLVVFITRYSDMLLEHHWGSLYFNSMRFIFVGITAYTIYVMRFKRPYKMVPPLPLRATIRTPTPSPTGPSTWLHWCWRSSSTGTSLSTGCCGPIRSGCKQWRSCRSCT